MIGRFGILGGPAAPGGSETPGLREYAQPDVKNALLGFYVPNKDRFEAIMQQRALIADLPNLKTRIANLESGLNSTNGSLATVTKSLSSLTADFANVRKLANDASTLALQLANQVKTFPSTVQDIADCIFNNGINKTTVVGDRVRTLIGGHRTVFDEVAARVKAGGNGFGWLMKNLGDNIPKGFGQRIKDLLNGTGTDGFSTSQLMWGPGASGHSLTWTDSFGNAQYADIVWPADTGVAGIARSRVSVAQQIMELAQRLHYDTVDWVLTDRAKRDANMQVLITNLRNAHNWAAGIEAFYLKAYTEFMVDKVVGPIEKMVQDALPHLYDAGGTLAGLPDAIKSTLDTVAASAKDLSDGNFGVGPRCIFGGGTGPGPIGGGGATIGGGTTIGGDTGSGGGTTTPGGPSVGLASQRYTDEDEDSQPSLV